MPPNCLSPTDGFAPFGHMRRIQRVFDNYVKDNRGKPEDGEHEVGRLLLLHRTSVHTEQKLARSERDRIYQGIYDKVIAGEITLQPHAELESIAKYVALVYQKWAARRSKSDVR